MAPELAANPAAVGPRTDIYSLGCTLYFLLTGRPPFEGRTAVEILDQQENQPLIPPDGRVESVPKSLSAIVLKMVARRPADRHADIADLIRDLEAHLGISSTGPDLPERRTVPAPRARRNRLVRVSLRSTSSAGSQWQSSRVASVLRS